MMRSISILLLFAGAAVAQMPPLPKFNLVTTTNAPQGSPATVHWSPSPDAVVGYRVYYFNASGPTNSIGVGNVTNVTIQNLFPPVWFYATAINAQGVESTNRSNLAAFLGWASEATLDLQSATNADGSFRTLATYAVTNLQPKEFFRLRITETNRMVTMP